MKLLVGYQLYSNKLHYYSSFKASIRFVISTEMNQYINIQRPIVDLL